MPNEKQMRAMRWFGALFFGGLPAAVGFLVAIGTFIRHMNLYFGEGSQADGIAHGTFLLALSTGMIGTAIAADLRGVARTSLGFLIPFMTLHLAVACIVLFLTF